MPINVARSTGHKRFDGEVMVDVDLLSDSGIAVLTVRHNFSPPDLIPSIKAAYEWPHFRYRWLVDMRTALLHGMQAAEFVPLLSFLTNARPKGAPPGRIAVIGKSYSNLVVSGMFEDVLAKLPITIERFTDMEDAMSFLQPETLQQNVRYV